MVDKVQILLLAVSIVAMINCMARSDYNIVVGLICYFYWHSRDNNRIPLIIMAILGVTILFDIVWMIIVWKSWTGSSWASPIWKNLRSLHITVLAFSILNIVLKIVAIVFVFLNRKKDPHSYRDVDEKNIPLN